MRVAYVGNFVPPHSTESDVAWTLGDMGHEVVILQESTLEWASLPSLTEGADLMLWTRTAGFDPPDHDLQRKAVESVECPTVGFHLDRWWGLARESTERGPADPDPSPFFSLDYLFTADGGHDEEWRQIGANHYWSPPGIARKNLERGRFRRHLWADVGFVGNLRRYGHAEWAPYRAELYRYLSRRFRRFRVWEGGVRGQMLADVYASVSVLVGDSCLVGSRGRYWSDRIPETLGRGGFLIHPEVEGFRDSYPEGTLVTYQLGDFDGLGDLIQSYLDDPEERQMVSEVGMGWVADHHTYTHRMERLLAIVMG